MSGDTTSQVDPTRDGGAQSTEPGLLLVFAAARPQLAALRTAPQLVLGRDTLAAVGVSDHRLSRRHAEVTSTGGGFLVRDLDSRNGTFVAAERLAGERLVPPATVLRVGDSLFITCADVAPFRMASVELDGDAVLGPRLQRVWAEIARIAEAGDGLQIQGETGSGKELAARHFHHTSGRSTGPFVAVNCATIPPAIAERLLFGARRGTYSGADADTEGYLQAADGGTLFLDEIVELGLEVQAKLLRVMESRQVLPLGVTRPRDVDVRVVSATHRDLRREVAAGRFREDFYYRIARPSVVVPPLHERREDVPWLLRSLLAAKDATMKLHVSFVEAVVERRWPGNVRELATELSVAAAAARITSDVIEAKHLSANAGRALAPVAPTAEPLDATQIARALADHGGKVATTARALGIHRNQLRRLIARYRLLPKSR